MIPAALITEWSQQCPWVAPAQVEQDLILSRALVEIYSSPDLCRRLVFRGGTALHKLVLPPAARYSEDIDLVQIQEEPIGAIMDQIRERLNPWLGEPKGDIGPRGATLTYRFDSEQPPIIRLRLKIEINTREHFHVLPLRSSEFGVRSRWFQGSALVPIYHPSELLGTKLRALYQRRKGRDLFDLWHAHRQGALDASETAATFVRYMETEAHPVSAADFQKNLAAKIGHPGFLSDTESLLRPGIAYDAREAHAWIVRDLVSLLP